METAMESLVNELAVRAAAPPQVTDSAERIWGRIIDAVDFDGAAGRRRCCHYGCPPFPHAWAWQS